MSPSNETTAGLQVLLVQRRGQSMGGDRMACSIHFSSDATTSLSHVSVKNR